jgi:CRP/FNR family nitrogen fixation transcriptional regulator
MERVMTLHLLGAPVKYPSGQCLPAPSSKSPFAILDSIAVRISYDRGQIISDRGRLADSWGRVLAGAAQKWALRADGARRIVDLLFPGDFFGLSENQRDQYVVEAVVDDTVLACYPRRRAETIADANPEVARAIREVAFAAIARAERQIEILGQKGAPEKVVAFLISLVARRECNQCQEEIVLPVSRYEIADYLAISSETVSRSLTGLELRGAIAFQGARKIRILEPEYFKEINGGRQLSG